MTDLVARLRLEATGGAQVAGEVRQVDEALGRVPAAANEAGRAVDRMGDQARAIAADFATLYDAAQRDFVSQYVSQVQAHVDATQRLGASQRAAANHFDTLYDATQQDFVSHYQRATTSIARDSGKAGAAAKLTANEMLNLSRQLADVGVTAAMGMNPLMILIQQGPQISEVFGTAAARGVSFKTALGGVGQIAGSVLGSAGPIALGIAVVGGLGAAFLKGSADAADFQNALTSTGNYAGLTADAYENMAQRISKATGESVRTSKAGISQLVASGQFSAATIEKMVEGAERYAQVTGRSTQEVLKDYAGMSQGVTDWAVKHALAHHDLTLAQIDYIARLEKAGDRERAYQQAMDDINASIRDNEKAYGFLEKALDGVAKSASNMWDKILGIGRPETPEQMIDRARKRIEGLNSAYNNNLVKLGGAGGQDVERARGGANLHLSLLEFNKDGIDAKARADAKRAQDEADAIRKKYGSGSSKPKGGSRFDASDMAIEAATRAELQARMALTRNVEQVAALKLREIDAEQKIQAERLARQVKEGSVSKDAAASIAASQARAAADQRELVLREKAAGVMARELEQRREMSGLLDRSATAQTGLTRSTDEAGRIAMEGLRRRQQLEQATLAAKNRERVISGEMTDAQDAELTIQLLATQAAEERQATLDQQAKTARARLDVELAQQENEIDVLSSQAALLKSTYARNVVELRILKTQHQIERRKLEEAIASGQLVDLEEQIARDRLEALRRMQANEERQLEEQITLLDAITDAADAVDRFKNAFKSRNWKGALDNLIGTIQSVAEAIQSQGAVGGLVSIGGVVANAVGGKTGRVAGTALGIAGMGLGVGAFAGTAAGAAALGTLGLGAGAIGSIAALAGPIGVAAAALYAAVKIFNIGGKPSNKGAGFDLVTGQISGNKRNEETDEAARKAGETILQMQAALREAGLGLTTTINGLVIGTRDQTQIYTSAGQTLTSAVGDVGAAVDTAMRALLEGATFQSENQKKLIMDLVAAGKGFDEIQQALANYAAGQKIPQQIQDLILQLTDPKAWALEELKRNQEEQRKGLKAAADAGFITAEQFAEASKKLTDLEGLQLEDVLKRFSDAVEETSDELEARAGRLRGSIVDRILELRDPAAFKVKRINDDINQRIDEARPLIEAGVLGEEFLSLAEQLRSLELGQLVDEVDATTKAFQDARPKLLSWIDQIRAGPAGELSPKAAREEAMRQFQRELAKAQAGDANALGNITSYADRLLETDRTATGSASARLALRNQVLGQIEGLAGRGATLTPAQAIQQLQAPLGQIAAASAAELATLTSAGKSVVIANLPSMQAMYGELVTTQTDRLVAANDRNAAEIVASVKALAESQAAALSQLAASVEGAVGAALEVAAGQAAEVAAGLQAIADEARLTDARQRAAG